MVNMLNDEFNELILNLLLYFRVNSKTTFLINYGDVTIKSVSGHIGLL